MRIIFLSVLTMSILACAPAAFTPNELGYLHDQDLLIKKIQDDSEFATKIDDKGRNLFHIAAILGNYNFIIKMVDDLGVDIEGIYVQDHLGNTPLHLATVTGNKDVINFFVEEDADVEAKNRLGHTPLHFLAHKNNLQLSHDFVHIYDADINEQDENGNTPFHFANSKLVAENNTRYLNFLLSSSDEVVFEGLGTEGEDIKGAEADPNIQNKAGETPLHLMISHIINPNNSDGLAQASLFFEAGADFCIEIESKGRKFTPYGIIKKAVGFRQDGLRPLLNQLEPCDD